MDLLRLLSPLKQLKMTLQIQNFVLAAVERSTQTIQFPFKHIAAHSGFGRVLLLCGQFRLGLVQHCAELLYTVLQFGDPSRRIALRKLTFSGFTQLLNDLFDRANLRKIPACDQ